METFDSLDDALAKYPDAYVSFAKIGNCMVCRNEHDLRCGVCFDCSGKITGKPIKGGHRLWEISNPLNTWYIGS